MEGSRLLLSSMLLAWMILTCNIAIRESNAGSVTYDHRALVIDGERRVLVSASIHYPRSTPEMWSDLIAKAKDGGADVIQTYVFWNMHEPVQGTYNFQGRFDLVRFLQAVQQAGLYVHLRIGPYACAEWNYGGFPMWLHFIPNIKFRTDNEPFKTQMQIFTAKIVQMMKEQQLYYWQGGPIILSQIENEYGNIDASYGAPGKRYMLWAAQMAVGLNTEVPWVMCQQSDAPNPIINTCNGFYCDKFNPNSYTKPKMWTENWSGWFLSFGGLQPHRPAEDLAFSVARFYEKGGTFQNYYMYHGGTNFGRTSGGPFISTSYDYDAPIDEYGNVRQPKWGHLKELHQAIKLCEPALILGDPNVTSFGTNLEGHVYTNGDGICAAFLANFDDSRDATVQFNSQSYDLPAWSVSILPDCKTVAFNTAKVSTQTSTVVMKTANPKYVVPSFSDKQTSDDSPFEGLAWGSYQEPIGVWGSNSFTVNGFLEQINTTRDSTDYLWYTTKIQVDQDEPFLHDGSKPTLSIVSLGHALHVFINGELAGSGFGSISKSEFQLELPVTLKSGENDISLLSMTVGLQNYGAFFDTWGAGIQSPLIVEGLKNGSQDISSHAWAYQIGLKGEQLTLHTESGDANVQWSSSTELPINRPMTWYKTTFNAPDGNDPVSLDLNSMGKGQAWVNGERIGRYWPAYYSPQSGCSNTCDYRGPYSPSKCATNCGEPSQRWYHVPRSWLNPTGNLLVLFEETGGDPTSISFATSSVATVCAHVSEAHLPPVDVWTTTGLDQSKHVGPEARLECPAGHTISSIRFSSFGNPQGTCGNFRKGSCHAPSSMNTLTKWCVGRQRCSIRISPQQFGADPCPAAGAVKSLASLAVEAACSA